MTRVSSEPEVIPDAPIATWFGVGGNADLLCRPADVDGVTWCVREFGGFRVLGDGANLLVADQGVGGLVADLRRMNSIEINQANGVVRAGAGANLPKLITQTVRMGLGGLEVLAGIPASVGGAAVMNAGGKFGSVSDRIASVDVVTSSGELEQVGREAIDYGYRHSGLEGIVVSVEFSLEAGDPLALRERLKSCMAYKKSTQPMASDSAGCCFRNPILREGIAGIGEAGQRVSAGMLLDRAGCKRMRVGSAVVSDEHANFLIAEQGASASELIALMDAAASRVRDEFGLLLEREVVVWDRAAPGTGGAA